MSTLLALTLAAATVADPALVRRTERPPNYETPVAALDQQFTPNASFFVRSHLSGIPKVDAKTWALEIGGEAVMQPLRLTLAELMDPKHFEQVEMPVLAVCSGNRRGLFDPHVPGVQWGHGAMGNAMWKGVRLRDVLKRAGVKQVAVEVVFDGADVPVNETTPDYRKSIPLVKALDPDTLIAYAMNGVPLPEAQGFPARIVVPGWTATYWVKQLVSVQVIAKPYDGFWTKTAYRIPKGKFPALETSWQATEANAPITELAVNSLITRPAAEASFAAGAKVEIAGFAWDGGHGIRKVEISTDAGKTWKEAALEKDFGRYSWRRFKATEVVAKAGRIEALSRATSVSGQMQAPEAIANPAGYHHNSPQGLSSEVAAASSRGEAVVLKPGVGHEKVATACATCHSLDYVEMNGSFLDRKGWEAVVGKMIKVYGAPVSAADLPVVVDYLAKSYGH